MGVLLRGMMDFDRTRVIAKITRDNNLMNLPAAG